MRWQRGTGAPILPSSHWRESPEPFNEEDDALISDFRQTGQYLLSSHAMTPDDLSPIGSGYFPSRLPSDLPSPSAPYDGCERDDPLNGLADRLESMAMAMPIGRGYAPPSPPLSDNIQLPPSVLAASPSSADNSTPREYGDLVHTPLAVGGGDFDDLDSGLVRGRPAWDRDPCVSRGGRSDVGPLSPPFGRGGVDPLSSYRPHGQSESLPHAERSGFAHRPLPSRFERAVADHRDLESRFSAQDEAFLPAVSLHMRTDPLGTQTGLSAFDLPDYERTITSSRDLLHPDAALLPSLPSFAASTSSYAPSASSYAPSASGYGRSAFSNGGPRAYDLDDEPLIPRHRQYGYAGYGRG